MSSAPTTKLAPRSLGLTAFLLAMATTPLLQAQPSPTDEPEPTKRAPDPGTDRDPEPDPEPGPEPGPDPDPDPGTDPGRDRDPGPQRDKLQQPREKLPPSAESTDDLQRMLQLRAGPFALAPVALLSAYATPFVGDESFFQAGDIAERPGFRLRHARFGFDARYRDLVNMRLTTEISGDDDGEMRVHDASIALTPLAEFGVMAGAQTLPMSRYSYVRRGRGALMERPFAVRALVPGHQIGAIVAGDVAEGLFGYRAGVFNGLRRGQSFYEGYERNYAVLGNRFEGVTAVARVTTEPLGPLDRAAYDASHGPFRFAVGGDFMFSHGGNTDVLTAGGDAHLQVAGFHAIGQFLFASASPSTNPTAPGAEVAATKSVAAVLEVGYVPIADLLLLAVRGEYIDPITAVTDESDNFVLTGGASVQLFDNLIRIMAEYTHREELGGLALANDTASLGLQLQLDPARLGRRDEPKAKAATEEPRGN